RVITPAGDPVRQLAIQLADLAGTDAISVHRSLLANPDQAHLLVGQALTAAGTPVRADEPDGRTQLRLVLVVDQLEELFTLTDESAPPEAFLTALHSMATKPIVPGGQSGALVIAGVRGDFLDQAMLFP